MLAQNLPGMCSELEARSEFGVRLEFARNLLGKQPGPAMRRTLHSGKKLLKSIGDVAVSGELLLGQNFRDGETTMREGIGGQSGKSSKKRCSSWQKNITQATHPNKNAQIKSTVCKLGAL